MRTIAIINGEKYWHDYLDGYEVIYRNIRDSRWIIRDDELWIIDSSGGKRLDGILWRLGAVKPHIHHRTALEIIRLANIPCLNDVNVLLRGYDRLTMLYELKTAQLPVIDFNLVLGEEMLRRLQPSFPCVVKVGNYHGGFGKALVKDQQQWVDIVDITFACDDYISVEPFIDYVRDIRCLIVGDQIWAMTRKSPFWKANTFTNQYQLIEPPKELADHTYKAAAHLQADILGLDFLETKEGKYILLESNDIPGLDGFPEEVKSKVADCFHNKMSLRWGYDNGRKSNR